MQRYKKYILLIILVAILIILGIYFLRPVEDVNIEKIIGETSYPPSLNYDSYSISDFKKNSLKPDFYDVEGYVVKKYECPPCASNEQCKPCMGDNIVISENNIPLTSYNLTDSELIIFGNNMQELEIGKKYRFSVELLESKRTDESINDISLLGFTPI